MAVNNSPTVRASTTIWGCPGPLSRYAVKFHDDFGVCGHGWVFGRDVYRVHLPPRGMSISGSPGFLREEGF